MDFVPTQHAQDGLHERGIALEWIARTLASPQLIRPDRADTALRHYPARIPELDNRVLRVMIDEQADPVRMMNFFVDRTMRDKL